MKRVIINSSIRMGVGCISKRLISIHWMESIFLKVSAFYARLQCISLSFCRRWMWSQHCTSCHFQRGILVSWHNPRDPACLQARWVGYSMQPSGDTLLLTCSTHKTLQLRERRRLCTSKHTDWGKICKSREFHKTCTVSFCAAFVLLLSWIIELLENAMQTAPEAHACLSPGRCSSATVRCW